MSDIVLSLLVLGVVVMAVGAWVAQRKGDRKRALLMLAVAAVMAMNVAIWTVPTAQDRSLAEAARGTD